MKESRCPTCNKVPIQVAFCSRRNPIFNCEYAKKEIGHNHCYCYCKTEWIEFHVNDKPSTSNSTV